MWTASIQLVFSEKEDIDKEHYKDSLNDVAYKNQIDKIDYPDKVVYIAASNADFLKIEDRDNKRDPKKFGPNQVGAFVKDKNSNKIIEINYSTICLKEKKSCTYHYDHQLKFVKTITKSIHFSTS